MRETLAKSLMIELDGHPPTVSQIQESLMHLDSVIEQHRNEWERLIEAVLVDRPTYDWYMRQIAIAKNAQYSDEDLLEFDRGVVEQVLENGLKCLTNKQLSSASKNPIKMLQLFRGVNGSNTDAWEELKVKVGEDLLRQTGTTNLPEDDFSELQPKATLSLEQTVQHDDSTNQDIVNPASLKMPANDTPSGQSSFRRSLPTFAASLLAAVSIAWSLWLSMQNASLTARIDSQREFSRKATSLTKESFGRTVADSTPLYLSGNTTPSLIRQALSAATVSSRSAALNDDEKAKLERGRMLFEEAISLQQLGDRPEENIVEEVTAAIWSGDLDRAEELLQSTELIPDDPAVINLKGVLAMYESEYGEDTSPDLQKEAESFFREAADKGELIAWINLAILLKRQGRTEEAVNALKMYIENASADEAEAVREFLPDATNVSE